MTKIKVELTWALEGQIHSHAVETEVKDHEGPLEVLRRATNEAIAAVETKTINW